MAVAFLLWRFSLRKLPLSLGLSYSLTASSVRDALVKFQASIFSSRVTHDHDQRAKRKEAILLGRVRLGPIRNKNNRNNASKRLFGSYSDSGIPGFHSGYSAPRSRIAGIYSGIHSYC